MTSDHTNILNDEVGQTSNNGGTASLAPLLQAAGMTLLLFVAACVPSDPASTADTSSATAGVSADAAIREISGNWSKAEDWVPRVKGKPGADKARDLYDEAKKANNAWLELLVTNIKDGKKPEKSSEFKNQSKVAAKATEDFVNYARSIQASPPKPGLAAAAVVDILINSGFKIWTEYGKHQQAQRAQKADDLAKRLKWPTWEKAGS